MDCNNLTPGESERNIMTSVSREAIETLFENWNKALQTGDSGAVAALYAPGAILVPTLSNRIRHTSGEIRDYFDHFLKKWPIGRLTESNIRIFNDVAVNSGRYVFSLLNASGGRDDVPARFTFVYRRVDSGWLIVEHHSSLMPE